MKTEIEQKYLNQGANYCPYCGSDHISGGHGEFDDTSCWREVECESCHKTWTEHFMMIAVEFDEDN